MRVRSGIAFPAALAVACLGHQGARAQEPTAGDAGAAAVVGEVVVTGSRISRKDYVANSPIVTTSAERLLQTPAVTVESTLNQLPQFVPSIGAGNAFPSTGGQAQLNLRGLGTNRTLVLLDGRRIQPSNPDGTIDINVIPSALISKIETITGGASATYGSDAVSGVANFLLKKNFEGFQVDAQYGNTTRTDGASIAASALVGGAFAGDRGHAALSVNYSKRNEIHRGDRSFFDISIANARLPFALSVFSVNPPSQAAVNTLFGSYGFAPGSVDRTSPLGLNSDRTLFSSPGTALGVVNYKSPPSNEFPIINNAVLFNFGKYYDIQIPLTRYNVFGNVDYDLSENVEVYSQFLYTTYEAHAQTSFNALGLTGQNGIVPATNPFIPPDLAYLLASRAQPNASFPITYSYRQRGPLTFDTKYEIYQVLGGLKGQVGGWSWDIYGQVGETDIDAVSRNLTSLSAANRLLAAPDGGASICAGGFNPFTTDISAALSPACQDYIYRNAKVASTYRQKVVEGTVQGSPFTLPAGEVSLAFGASYRRDEYIQSPDQHARSGDLVGFAAISPAAGSQRVAEVFSEVLVPILKDLPFVNRLELDAAYRYSHYSTVGSIHTYKADLDWDIAPILRLRGGFARATRAPSLGELNSPATVSSVTIGRASPTTTAGDPCDVNSSFRLGANAAAVRGLCLAQGVPSSIINNFTFSSQAILAVTQGNPDLGAEKSDTYSVGMVLRSPFTAPALRQFQASLDYYNITIDNAIGTLPFATALARCFNADGSNPSYSPANTNCSVISRDSLGSIQQGKIATLNLAKYETSGIDLQIDWQSDLYDLGLGNIGRIELNFIGGRIFHMGAQTLPGLPSQDFVGFTSSPITPNTVLPKLKTTLTATYTLGGLSIGARWRYIDGTEDISRLTTPTSTVPGVPAYNYFDLFGSYRLRNGAEVRAGLTNIADKGPPQIGTAIGNTDFSTYDLIGRSFYVGVRAKF